MSLPDSAEYWWDVKASFNNNRYRGVNFRHIPNSQCGHIRPITGNDRTTPYIEDINCFACIKLIEEGFKDGLIEGKAPDTYYMSNSERKRYNARKRFNEQHGVCSCGSNWQIRSQKNTGKQFLGCSNYPNCKNTKSIQS